MKTRMITLLAAAALALAPAGIATADESCQGLSTAWKNVAQQAKDEGLGEVDEEHDCGLADDCDPRLEDCNLDPEPID